MTRTVVIDRDKFYKVVDGSKQQLIDCILGGRCTSFDDYRSKVGKLHGLNEALDHFKDTVKSEDDEDE